MTTGNRLPLRGLLALALLLVLCGCVQGAKQLPSPEPEAPQTLSWDALEYERSLDLLYAEQFSVDYYTNGYQKIAIGDGNRYLVVPEGANAPSGIPEEVTVLYQPLDSIYLVATSAMDLFRQLDAIDAITLAGLDAGGWYIPEAREAIEAGRMVFAGKYGAPDYERILDLGCDLAVESTMIYHTPEVKEQLERLGIPVLVERSSYESHPLGRMEWVKLYGALLNRELEAETYFRQQLEQLAPVLEQENTGKTVAFFYITSNGAVSVRKSGDYIAKAIDLAGGVYALRGLTDEENALSTMNIQMETFYQEARDADVLIYNSAIDADLETISQLVDKSAPLADFKAVQSGDVWCTGKSMFQESQSVGSLILDIHAILSGEDEGGLVHLHRLA